MKTVTTLHVRMHVGKSVNLPRSDLCKYFLFMILSVVMLTTSFSGVTTAKKQMLAAASQHGTSLIFRGKISNLNRGGGVLPLGRMYDDENLSWLMV